MSESLSNDLARRTHFDSQGINATHVQDKLPLYIGDDDIIDDFLDLKEVDPITNSSFEMMIKVAFRADRNFILAKVKTRSV